MYVCLCQFKCYHYKKIFLPQPWVVQCTIFHNKKVLWGKKLTHAIPITTLPFSTFRRTEWQIPTPRLASLLEGREIKLLNTSFPWVGTEPTTCCVNSRKLVPQRHNWPRIGNLWVLYVILTYYYVQDYLAVPRRTPRHLPRAGSRRSSPRAQRSSAPTSPAAPCGWNAGCTGRNAETTTEVNTLGVVYKCKHFFFHLIYIYS